jgi:predicted DNA-binding transcriptional regulator YafY
LTDPGYPVLGNMAGEFFKRDRTARLLGVAHLLFQHPHGLTAQQIAERIGVNVRTVYRDLRALEEEVGVGVWQEGRRYGAETTSFLPPLKLTLQEAVTVFLSARLMDRFKDYRDPWVVSTFNKLASVLPSPVARHVHASLASMADRPRDEHRNRVFDLLATSWADGLKVRIWYQGVHDDLAAPARERLLSPYFLEPNARGHSSYVIGHDSCSNAVRAFKLERIQQVELTQEHFDLPPAVDLTQRLRQAWGISDEGLVEVVLRFHDLAAARRARASRWHSSQRDVVHPDGTLDLIFEVGGLLEITPWVLGWGDSVEVLAPSALRERIVSTARGMTARYGDHPAQQPEDHRANGAAKIATL